VKTLLQFLKLFQVYFIVKILIIERSKSVSDYEKTKPLLILQEIPQKPLSKLEIPKKVEITPKKFKETQNKAKSDHILEIFSKIASREFLKSKLHLFNLSTEAYPDFIKGNLNMNIASQEKLVQNPIIKEVSMTNILDKYNDLIIGKEKIYAHENEDHKKSKMAYRIELKNGMQFVLKIEIFPEIDQKKMESCWREYHIGRTFGAICKYIAKCLSMKCVFLQGDKKKRVELLQEYGGIGLDQLALKNEDIPKIISQLINALTEMERHGISHYDIKSSNIVWNSNTSQLKIIDFGASIQFYRCPERSKVPLFEKFNRVAGYTTAYAPHEINEIKDFKSEFRKIISQKVDVYTFGILLEDLLCKLYGLAIIQEKNHPEIHHQNAFNKIKKKHPECLWIGIISQCISHDPNSRPSFASLKIKIDEVLKYNNLESCIEKTENAYYKNYDVYDTVPTDKYNYIPRCCETFKFLDSLRQATFGKAKEKDLEVGGAISNLGNMYYHLGKYNEAIEYFTEYKKVFTNLEGNNSLHLALNSIDLAMAYFELGKNNETLENLFNAEKSIQDQKDINQYILIVIYYNLGIVFDKKKDFDKALFYFKKAKKIMKEIKASDFPSAAEIYNAIGNEYYNKKNFFTAHKYYELAKKYAKKYYGKNHTETAKIYNNIGILYASSENEIEDVEKYFEKAENITRGEFRNIDLELAMILHNMGLLQSKLKKYENAIKYFKNSIEILEIMNENSVEYLPAMYDEIAKVYIIKGKNYKLASEYLEKSINASNKIFGENDPKTTYRKKLLELCKNEIV